LCEATPAQLAAIATILGLRGGRECEVEQLEDGKTPSAADVIQRVGRFAYRNDFADVWLGDEHFDLSRRAKARACLRYLVEHRAFDTASARHLETEIDPYVRGQCQLPALPYGELKVHHYFNPSTGDVARLGRELIRAAGRNGRYFLCVR
jgi:hypothetical protein